MKQEIKEKIEQNIKAGMNYSQTKENLAKEGITEDFHSSFYRMREKIRPTKKVDKALEDSAIKREKREDKHKKTARKTNWTTAKQKAADDSGLAKVINKGVFYGVMPLCKNKQLKESDVQDANLGGAVVANITYFFPNVDLSHPLIVLVTRGILFFIRFKAICSSIAAKVESIKEKLTIGGGGIKEEFRAK